jgi:hypothetical protein
MGYGAHVLFLHASKDFSPLSSSFATEITFLIPLSMSTPSFQNDYPFIGAEFIPKIDGCDTTIV